ncbi:MAG: hypothetical protein ABIU95_05305 [Burkholderiales bacterium]
MPASHAVVWIDHHHAQVVQIDAEHVHTQKLKEHKHYTRQHGSEVRSEHEFFAQVCDALAGFDAVLVTGSQMAQAAFRHYVDKHRAALAPKIAGWETVGQPTEGELVELARQFFVKRGEMPATPRLR